MRDRSRLRAVNAVISAAMMALFLVHGVGNAFQMMGVGTPLSKALSWTLVGLCVAHAIIGVVLTADTLRAQQQAGVSYPSHNLRFWIVRVSGLAVGLLVLAHVVLFLKPSGVVRLNPFQMPQLLLSLALVASLALHVLANMLPLMVHLGIPAPSDRALDLVLVVAALLALMAVGFVVYFVRWSVV